MKRLKYEEGEEVYWTDPEGESSGKYRIVKQLTEDSKGMSIFLLSNGFSDVEAYKFELK